MKEFLLLACGIMIGLLVAPHFQKAAKPTSPIGAFLHRYLQPEAEQREGGRIDPETGRFVLYSERGGSAEGPGATAGADPYAPQISERSGPEPAAAPAPGSSTNIRDQWGWQPRGALDQPARR